MGKITGYSTLTAQHLDDMAVVVNVHDPAMASSGSEYKISLGRLLHGLPSPWVTVAPIGLSAGGAVIANNGADYGPDTPGTVTCGIQEALNSLPATTVYDGANNAISGQRGALLLQHGVFSTSGPIVLPAGQIGIQGGGQSTWIPVENIPGPYFDLGGTAITGSDFTHSVISVPMDSFGHPATALWLRDLDIRMVSPASAQTSSAPSVLSAIGHLTGEVSNVNVMELLTAGGIGNNMYIMADFSSTAWKDDVLLMNVRGYGGHTGVRIAQAHVTALNISGGKTATTIDNFDCGVDIRQDLNCFFAGLHGYSSTYGLAFWPYAFGQPWAPQVIHGFHFESVTHYLLCDANNLTGTLIIDQPVWDQPALVPATDIAATLATASSTPVASTQTGLAVITMNELDPRSLGGRHVTVPKGAWTAGTSPYTFTSLPYDCIFVLTTVGGMTALTLDGQALFNAAFAIGQQVFVSAGHTLIATWATTAPVFQVIPQ